jgi:hypothetical protein
MKGRSYIIISTRNHLLSFTYWCPENIGDFAPKLVELTDNFLFGEVWVRSGISPSDRSLITVASLCFLYLLFINKIYTLGEPKVGGLAEYSCLMKMQQ